MTIQYTESDKYYFVRKPHGIPTTFGSQFSFLEKIIDDEPPFFVLLKQCFDIDEEYGLLNRLDNDTAGFLYFAKSKSIKDEYKKLQDEQKINKIYIANLQGKVDIDRTAEKHEELKIQSVDFMTSSENFKTIHYVLCTMNLSQDEIDSIKNIFAGNIKGLVITYPIMHHIHDDIRMVAIRIQKDYNKGRGEEHLVETTIFPIKYNVEDNTTLCVICIHQGIRHQIRVHCASIGYPVDKDRLYGKRNAGGDLQLWSVGIL